jgi:capsule polysaccharide export protein KpsE/RkpR
MDEPVNKTRPSEDEVFLLDYLIILAKHSRMIIFVSAAATLLIYGLLFCSPNSYKAKALILLPQQNMTLSAQLLDDLGARVSPGVGGGGLGGGMASLLGLKTPGEMYTSMLQSDPVLDNIVTRFRLMDIYESKYLEEARETLKKNVDFTPGSKDNIVGIEVTCTTPELAAEIANVFIKELDQLLQRMSIQETEGRLAFLQKQRLRASQDLNKAQESLRQFSEEKSVLHLETQTKLAVEYIARLRAEIDVREVSIQVLRQRATPLNYEVVRVEAEIKGLREKLRSAESQIGDCVSDVCMPASKTPDLAMKYLDLFREAKFQEGLYTLYSKLVEFAHLDMSRDVSVIQVVALAIPPERRSNKRLLPALVVGTIIFFMMVLIAFGLEYWQNANKREDDAQRLTLLKGYLTPWANVLIRMKNIFGFKRKSTEK